MVAVTRPRWLEPVLVGLALAGFSFAWIVLDHSVWPWDPAWYGEVSLDLYSTLRLDLHSWADSMLNAFGQKAPGVAWLGQLFVPLGGVFGSDGRALLLSIVLTQTATLALVYAAARRAAPGQRAAALAAALLLAGAPLFVGLSHQYFAEPLQGLAVAWVLYVLVAALAWRPALTVSQLAGALGLGMLAKVSTPAYAGLPALAALALSIWAARRRPRDERPWYRDRAVLLSTLLAGVLVIGAAGWYLKNGRTALHHAAFAAGSELYGGGGSYLAKLSRWIDHLGDALFWDRIDVLLGVTLLAAGALIAARRARVDRTQLVQVAACAATVCVLLLLFARAANEDVRFLLGALPHVSLLLAFALAILPRPLVIAVMVLLAAQFGLVNARALGVGERSSYPYLAQPVTDSALRERLQELVHATCTAKSDGRISVVGGDYPWLNGNTLSLLADEEHTVGGHECEYTALGYAETDADAAWQRVLSLSAPYYVTIDYEDPANRLAPGLAAAVPSYDAFNRVNRAVFRRALGSGVYSVLPGTRRDGFVALHRSAEASTANYDGPP